MIDVLVISIGASLLLYVLLGGSDYGAGIIELLPAGRWRARQREVIDHAMGPVWEANHLWLILVVVILFTGFPSIFTTLMTALHLPMLALLAGVVVRGAAFTFRHYDPGATPVSQRIYTVLFGFSSLWSALWLGVIVASLSRGRIDRAPANFWEGYLAPWWGAFPLTVGMFVACIFAFLASVYLVGETTEVALRKRFVRLAATFNVAVLVSGAGVFLASYGERENLPRVFFRTPSTVVVMVAATGLFALIWVALRQHRPVFARAAAVGQVSLILLGWWLLYSPYAIITTDGALSFYETAAPVETQRQLVIALAIGAVFIFPSLYWLLRVFKFRPRGAGSQQR